MKLLSLVATAISMHGSLARSCFMDSRRRNGVRAPTANQTGAVVKYPKAPKAPAAASPPAAKDMPQSTATLPNASRNSDTNANTNTNMNFMPGRLTLNNFEQGGDGGGAGACFGKFYSSSLPVIALATAAYAGGANCGKKVTIRVNGKSTTATVVDMCDTARDGCLTGTVDASKAVWDALGINTDIGVIPCIYAI